MEDQTFLQLVQSLGRMGTDASKPRLTKMSRSVGSSRAFSVLTIGLSLGLGACSAGGTGASADGPGGTPGIGGGFGTGGGFFGTGGAVGAGGAGTGGTGTGGISSAGGDTAGGGTTAAGGGPDAGAGGVYTYDPSVAFDWPEATVTAGSCKPGKYQGTFSGWYDADIIAGFPVPIAGNVNLTLAQSADGEFFQVTGGDISGLVYGFIPFSSGLTGTLNCKTLKLENGYMPHGKYTIIGVDYPYEGPLHADYDKLTNQFTNGKWRVGEPTWKEGDPDPKFGGFGDWTVTWMSP